MSPRLMLNCAARPHKFSAVFPSAVVICWEFVHNVCLLVQRQLAVFAEFRHDWQGAVTSYQAAAAALQGVPLGRPTVSCQRHAEVVAVAEVVHFKAMMLLLHQQRYEEAVRQLATHLAVFGRIPGDGGRVKPRGS